MNAFINMYAGASGVWKKIAAVLPFIIGAGSLLCGLGGICLELGHAANAAGMLDVLRGLATDANTAEVLAGLTALGIHSNHAALVAAQPPAPPAA
jgi:hypothetical protein